jgi:hypothetical protein
MNGYSGGGGYGGGDATPFAGECAFKDFAEATWEEMVAAHPGEEAFYDQACAEAWETFDSYGGLSEDVQALAEPIIRGDHIGNAEVREALTANGERLQDWWKMETNLYPHSQSPFRVHYYEHLPTGRVYTGHDFKVIFEEMIFPG